MEELCYSEYNYFFGNQISSTLLSFLFQENVDKETVTSDQEGEVQQGNFIKALQTIAFIMNGSIDLGTTLNRDSEATIGSFNSETSVDLNSQASTEEDSDTVSSSYSETSNKDLDSETSEGLKSKRCSSTHSDANTCLKSTLEFIVTL